MLQISMSGTVVLVHGAGGSVGSEVARSFAHAGASVHLTGRTEGTLMETTDAIVQAGRRARAHQLDVTHGQAVRQCVETVLETEGRIDVVYNAVTHEETQGTPLHELDVAAAERTLTTVAQVHLNTVSSVVSTMIKQRSGVIQTMVGYGPPFPLLGTTAIAWQTVEAIYRQFAVELGPYGIRVQRFRTGGFRESILQARDYGSSYEHHTSPTELLDELADDTMLRRLPSLKEAAALAVVAASDHGASLTATAINLTAGSVAD